MAADFLKGYGIDLQYEMSRVQYGATSAVNNPKVNKKDSTSRISKIENARLPAKDPDTRWDISICAEKISSICPHNHNVGKAESFQHGVLDAKGCILAPSLCHPHIHLDKCFLLYDKKYSDLGINKGDFEEALCLTAKAKSRFETEDLLRRGRWLITESIAAGVTCMRAFVEIDNIVGFKCLDAGLRLKEEFKNYCEVQICVFQQEPVFSSGRNYSAGANLIEKALERDGVDALGSTPYVEQDVVLMRSNIEWAIKTALKYNKHLDFHIDYNLDRQKAPLVPYVIEMANIMKWSDISKDRTIVLGHCTRLTLLNLEEWQCLQKQIGGLPIFFVGLPTSDIFMMGKPDNDKCGGERVRGTLQIPELIHKYNLDGAIGVNNVGNAFTPQGNCDPMSIASMGVGLYQSGTKTDTDTLYVRSKLVLESALTHLIARSALQPAPKRLSGFAQ